jgi:hypothetical protein
MDELEVDFIIEDLLSSPAQVDGAIDFDLVDLFDLPSSAALTIFSPTADRLDFDLVELFDLPSAAPVVTPTLDLDRIGTTISELRQNFESLLERADSGQKISSKKPAAASNPATVSKSGSRSTRADEQSHGRNRHRATWIGSVHRTIYRYFGSTSLEMYQFSGH